ncbi:hypothetical protein PtA15_12A391 [Puccinia triticina]|uniref:Uncharacterized protein n=1 Tax=Puccinia triticina TaxID=208348 RepID=A0ABY7D649_9BASI|nr:uncharacterized protein PtA15_12A391 [Puccinia triticina]WAQ90402.1 hypothetical protein PtA15_12A391 [Puccinia triticina]WAR61718.1 hypothetical protein PtB15_12B408 [Puccinia triticina]
MFLPGNDYFTARDSVPIQTEADHESQRGGPDSFHPCLLVPAGTNGAVSILGLVFSALGGLLVGGVSSFVGEQHQSRRSMIVSCGIFGLFCSMVDSVLGATLQQTVYSKNERRVVAKSKVELGGSREIVVICGIDLLTNNQVNLISSTATGLLAGLLSYYSIIP